MKMNEFSHLCVFLDWFSVSIKLSTLLSQFLLTHTRHWDCHTISCSITNSEDGVTAANLQYKMFIFITIPYGRQQCYISSPTKILNTLDVTLNHVQFLNPIYLKKYK